MFEFVTENFAGVGAVAILGLFIAAVVAGYIDTLVGGGGLITIPALLLAGIPPIQALGTNKLQASAGTGTATITLLTKNQLQLDVIKWSMLFAFFGAIIGAVVVQFVDADVLSIIVPIVIVVIAIYFVIAPSQNIDGGEPKISGVKYRCGVVPTIGFYDGMFGPATGSFFVLAGVGLRGQSIVKASMVAKSLNFATNIASLLVFYWFGQIAVVVGLVMMLGQFVGASFGARALMRINPEKLRYMVVLMCVTILVFWFVNR